jgi:peptidoglycan/LPS O-acetylase OafA/YrhL
MNNIHKSIKFWLIAIAVLCTGALLSALDGGNWLRGWLAYSLLLGIGTGSLALAWRLLSPDRPAAAAAVTAFIVRVVIGVTLTLLLPVIGYANNVDHQAGYVFTDANNRDNQAWELAISDEPLSAAFSGDYESDQYGGLLGLSALLYRVLSPDAHRPMLLLALNASAAAWGVLLLWKATRSWFGDQSAAFAAWAFAIYPESVLLASSQMREALIIPAVALTIYAYAQIRTRQRLGWLWLAAAALILFPIQPLAGFAAFGVLAGFWLFDPASLQNWSHRRGILTAGIILAVGGVVLLVTGAILANLPSVQGAGPFGSLLTWLHNNFTFQSYLAERASGMLQKLLDGLPEQLHWLVILVYGIAQPVLPAMVGDPDAAWAMRLMGVLRAAGWYALAPFLVYAVTGILRLRGEPRRWQLLWVSLVGWAWIAISALNAGGDQWDNPRYRTILLAWLVLLAGWAWGWVRARKDAWFGRWLAVEAVFVLIFTEWYLGRYYPGFPHLDIQVMIIATLGLTVLILGGGWAWDRYKRK